MKGWKFALIPALLLGGGLLSGCGQTPSGNQGNQNPPLANEEVQALIAPLLAYGLQSVGYASPTYTPQENRSSVETQGSFSYSSDRPCPYGGYMTYQVTANTNASYTGGTYSGSIVTNGCGETPELTYQSGTSRFEGSVTQVSSNTVRHYHKQTAEVTAIFRGQSYFIQSDLEGTGEIVLSGRVLYLNFPASGTVRINGRTYSVSFRQAFTISF